MGLNPTSNIFTCLRSHIKRIKHQSTAIYIDDCIQCNCRHCCRLCWEANNQRSRVILVHALAGFKGVTKNKTKQKKQWNYLCVTITTFLRNYHSAPKGPQNHFSDIWRHRNHYGNFWAINSHIPVKHHRGTIRLLEGNWLQQLGIISALRYEAITDDVNDFFGERHLWLQD